MSRGLNRFNWLARHYDFLAGLVFGKAIFNSQLHFLESIPQRSQILMIGGGSGRILPALLHVNPTCSVWYVEASSAMISIASERVPEQCREQVKFIHGTEEAIPAGIMFDVIMTHFLLDLFPAEKGFRFCQDINSKLKPGGLWLISDFVDNAKWWQRLMLRVMYRFFVWTSCIEATSLPPWQQQLQTTGMREKASKFFFGGFIKSVVYGKDWEESRHILNQVSACSLFNGGKNLSCIQSFSLL